jgi:adenosine deaminase
MPPGKHDYDLNTWACPLAPRHRHLGGLHNLPSSFFPLFSSYIYNLVNDVATLRYTTLSVLRDFAADGVVYLELRTTPRAMPAAGLTEEGYIQTILDTIAEYEQSQAAEPEPKLRTKLILSVRPSRLPNN